MFSATKIMRFALVADSKMCGPNSSMASQAFSASANVLKGDPPTLTAGLLIWMGRPRSYKARPPASPGPLLLSLLITNEKPPSLALDISNSAVAGPTRLKCGAITARFSGWGRQPDRQVFSRSGGLWASAGSDESTVRGLGGSSGAQHVPAAGLTNRRRHSHDDPLGLADCETGAVGAVMT